MCRTFLPTPALPGFPSFLLSVVLVGLIALFCSAASAASAPEFPPPKGAKVSRVARSVQTNGLTMDIREFHTNHDMDKVRAFYARTWPAGKDDPGVLESDAAQPWTVLSRVEEGYLLTIQMQPTDMGGTWGYLGMARLPTEGDPQARPSPPRSLRGTILISSNKSEDEGQSGEVFLLGNEYSVRSNLEFYKGLYSSWRVDMEQSLKDGMGYALSFSRGSHRVNLTIVDGGKGSYVTINIIRKAIL